MPKLKNKPSEKTDNNVEVPAIAAPEGYVPLEEFRNIIRTKIYENYKSLNQFCSEADLEGYNALQISQALSTKKIPSRKLLMKVAEYIGLGSFKEVKLTQLFYVKD